jgi:hypothetical protein
MQDEKNIILGWLDAMSTTVAARDLDAHMALVSRKVHVHGLPGKRPTIDYAGWRRRRAHEFKRDLLAAVSYEGLTLRTITSRRLAFKTRERMLARSGEAVLIDKDITLELEDDEHWRVVEEVIRRWEKQPK